MAVEWDDSVNRRLPVYLLLDCSSSMAGVKIQQVNTGVQMLFQELMADPRSADTIWISIIPFASSAYQMDLVPIAEFTPPQLIANGQRALGAALSLLNQSLDSDLIINQPGKKGDYKPLVFILTDGPPTDTWQVETQRLKSRTINKTANIIALAIGDGAHVPLLKQITNEVLQMENVTGDYLRAFFQWVSQSVQTASKARQGAAQNVQAPLPPPGIQASIDLGLPPARPAVSSRIFVSHSHHDAAFTERLVGDLRTAGAQVWVDDADMHPGEFPQQISDALAAAEWVIVVLTPDSAASRWVRREVDAGIARMDHDLLRGVIPIMAAHTDPRDIPPLWLNLHRYDATRDYDAALQGMLRAIGLR